MAKGKETRYFSKTINDQVVTQVAHSAADGVRYTYDGWRDITAEVKAAQDAVKAAAEATPAKPAEAPAKK